MSHEDSLLSRFNRYRFDYASLVFDAGRAFLSQDYRTRARLTVVPLFVFMLCPPTVTLVVGLEPFGDVYVFAAALLIWPWVLEMPAWSLRQWRADPIGSYRGGTPGFDWFIHAFFCLTALICIALVAFAGAGIGGIEHGGKALLAVTWAVALAGSTDLARSLVALFLARLEGFPLYGQASRF